jgi:hypothetical protein
MQPRAAFAYCASRVPRVATSELFPTYTKLSRKVLRKAARRREATIGYSETGVYRVAAGLDLFWLTLRCPTHAWSWPRTNKDEECVEGFDAHQTCHKCMSLRMFDSRKWHAGLIYRHQIRPEADRQRSANFGKKAEPSLSPGYPVDWIRSRAT